MVSKTNKILTELVSLTDSVILFHSGLGKDSIALMDILYKKGLKVQPIIMNMVDDLEQIQRYVAHTEKKYNVKFIQVMHPVKCSYIKQGYMGIEKDEKQILSTIGKVAERVCKETKTPYSVYGFKKVDGLNRRIMLNEINNGIFYKTNKCYPLGDWLNKEVFAYKKANKLIQPIRIDNRPSFDIMIDDYNYLSWCKKNYYNDYLKIINDFPEAEAIILSKNNEN